MLKNFLIFSILLAIVSLYLKRPVSKIQGRTVETKNGLVTGIVSQSRDGRDFEEWLGIPYAEPPVGKLRFQNPQPTGKWPGVRDGSTHGPQCPQSSRISLSGSSYDGEEDCLFLNVHVPKINLQKLLPVMVWIHGGGFNMGSGSSYLPDFFMDEDVVVVTLNYRLGALGFLNTGDRSIRGNMGLKDQVLALKWVKENIEAFGGDSNQITVFGESAGGASTHYLMLSATTKGLFQKVISQSGVATLPWASHSTEMARQYTGKFAALLNCPTADSSQLTECLRGKSVGEIMKASRTEMDKNYIFHPHLDGQWFRPSVEAVDDEEAFFTEHPLEAVQARKFHRIPWMAGVNADEGLISSLEFIKSEDKMKAFEDNWTENVLRTFGIPENTPNSKEMADKLKELYFPKKDEPFTKEKKLQQYSQLFTDSHFFHHGSYNYWIHKPFVPVYLYYFNRPGPSIAPIILAIQDRFHPIIEVCIFLAKMMFNNIVGSQPQSLGVCHGDDLAMLFIWEGLFNVEKDEASLDYKFSKDMVKLWVQFATNENEMEFRGVKWAKQRHTPGRLSYLELSETPKIIQEPFEERMDKLTYLLKLW